MMALTHATIVVAGTSLILGTANPVSIGLAIVGSQFPDIDTTSAVGQICFPISNWIKNRFLRWTISYCLLTTVAIALVSLAVG